MTYTKKDMTDAVRRAGLRSALIRAQQELERVEKEISIEDSQNHSAKIIGRIIRIHDEIGEMMDEWILP